MSFFTSFWFLLQKEQRSKSPSPEFFAITSPCQFPLSIPCGSRLARPASCPLVHHLIDDAVILRLSRVHDEVAIGVLGDRRERLAASLRQELVEPGSEPDHFARLNIDVRG